MPGKYHEYPAYVDSGVVWLGSVPAHWEPIRFKHRLMEKKKTSNSALEAGSISFGKVVYKSSENLDPATKASYQEVLEDEFLINPLNMNYDLLSLRTALSEINVVVSTGYIVVRSDQNLAKRYVRWLLQEFDVAHMKTLGSGVRQTINYMDIGNSFFYEPPYDEQQKIANFLDYETARIDTLIEKQQQLIALLKEKRQAVISHAVTKGLNPDAPMRDSGVEWLGELPEHWKIVPLVSWADVVDPNPSHRNPIYTDEGFPFISTVEFSGVDDLELNTPRRVSVITVEEQEHRCSFQEGSIAFSRKGTIGAVRVLPNDTRFALLDSVCVINCKPGLEFEFLYQQIRSSVFDSQLGQETRGAALPQVSVGKVRSVRVFLPPLEEQKEIVRYLKKKLAKLDESSFLSKKQISLLKERRTALISAAVTGKIDVRNWQPPESSNDNSEQGVA